jgi:hypothetical protein
MTVLTPDRAPAPGPSEPVQDQQQLLPDQQQFPPDQQLQHQPSKRPWWWYALAAAVALVVGVGVYFAVTAQSGGTSAAVTNSHSAVAGEPALMSVPGYQYVDVPVSMQSDLQNTVDSVNQSLAQANPTLHVTAFTGSSVHGIVTQTGQEPSRYLFMLQVNPALMRQAPPNAEQNLVAGMAGGMATHGASVSSTQMSGQQVVVADMGDGGSIYAWFHDNTIYMVMSTDASNAKTFAADYLSTASYSVS